MSLEDMLLNQLKNNNPSAYNELMSLKNSGKNPQQIVQDLISSGRFSQSQLNEAQNMLNNGGYKTF